MTAAKPARVSPYLLLALTTLFWAGNWVVGRAIRHDVPPLALAFWRWAIAAVLLLPFAWKHVVRQRSLILANLPILVLLAVLGTGLYNALAYWGLQYTTATNGVLLNSATPILIIAISAIFFGERLSLRQNLGVLVSLVGVLAIVRVAAISRGSPRSRSTSAISGCWRPSLPGRCIRCACAGGRTASIRSPFYAR